MSSSSTSLTFKLCFDSEIRRFSIDQQQQQSSSPSFSSLYSTATEISHLPTLKLTWHDSEGDIITIRNQGDLDEVLSFLVSSGFNTMKIFIEADTTPSTASTTTLSTTLAVPPYSSAIATTVAVPQSSYFPQGNFEKVRLLEDTAAPGFSDKRIVMMDPKLRKKLEKMNKKLGEKYEHCQKKLTKLRDSPHFDEKEHIRQIQVLRDAEIDICPAISFAVAKRIVEQNKEQEQEEEQLMKEKECCWGRRWRWRSMRRNWIGRWVIDVAEGKGNWIPDDKKVATLSEKTQRQVKVLRENQMPCGWPIIMGLEFLNLQAANLSAPEIQEQYNQVRDLNNLPEPIVIWMLKIESEQRKERVAKEQEKQERKERCCERRKENREARRCGWGGRGGEQQGTSCCQ